MSRVQDKAPKPLIKPLNPKPGSGFRQYLWQLAWLNGAPIKYGHNESDLMASGLRSIRE